MTNSETFVAPDSSADQQPYIEWRVLLMTMLMSIATIIGSGILALPVTMWNTSLTVFLVLFTITLMASIGTVSAAVEVMQRVRLQRMKQISINEPTEFGRILPSEEIEKEVTLFEMATLFLPNPIVRASFHVMTIISFVALLVSYGLAAPQALYQIILNNAVIKSSPPSYLLFIYSAIAIVAVVFFANALLPFFSTLTIAKGVLMTLAVVIVMLLPSSLHLKSLSDLFFPEQLNWTVDSVITPYLLSSVALVGLSNTMPVTFRLLPSNANRDQIRRYTNAVITGLVLCYFLNVVWVVVVMQVVPRVGNDGISLHSASEHGQISTVPLIAMLTSPKYSDVVSPKLVNAIGTIVNLFIVISTSVSFFIIGSGCKNYLNGALQFITKSIIDKGWSEAWKGWVYVIGHIVVFASIVVIIIWNPNSFISVLAHVSSLSLNFQCGALIFVMMFYARKLTMDSETQTEGEVPFKSPINNVAAVLGTIFFLFACILVLY